MLIFEWDENKASFNSHKHKVTFEEASTAFQDTLSLTIGDPLHSQNENRLVLIGMSYKNRLLVVIHTERDNNILNFRRSKRTAITPRLILVDLF